ncbi:glycosyltransferase family 2 protein [Candidatus Roizmanbacteria bacterium]|nr:glycosyltransferase family 2 protein [Candidatus Roizmanbacteria bacterium]
MKDFLLSVIIPVYNEEKNIAPLLRRLLPVLEKYRHEILFIDDGSSDKTASEIKRFISKNSAIKLVRFLRNFGHQMALSAGYQLAQGDCVVSLDADLQDPPEVIPKMVEKWQKGMQIVYAKRSVRDVDGPFKKLSAGLFYRFINFLSDTKIPSEVGDFRLLDKEVVSYINALSEQSLFLRGLVAWGGYPSASVEYKRERRYAGGTHYTFSKMANLALEGITSFSTKPLRLATYLGFVFATLGVLGVVYAVLGKIFLPEYWVPGWTALFVGIMSFGGVQLITIGIIGEYIGKIYKEVQRRPKFLIKEKVNLD